MGARTLPIDAPIVSSIDGGIVPALSRRRAEPPSGFVPRAMHRAEDDPGLRRRRRGDLDRRETDAADARRVVDSYPTSFHILDRPIATFRASLSDWTRRLASARALDDRASRRDRARLRDAAKTWRAATRRARVRRARAALTDAFAVRSHRAFASASVSIAEALWRLREGESEGGWRRVAVDREDENRREDAAPRLESAAPRTLPPRRPARWILVRAPTPISIAGERESFAFVSFARAEALANPAANNRAAREAAKAVKAADARSRSRWQPRDLDDAVRARASHVEATARRVRTIVADAIATAVTDASADRTAFEPNRIAGIATRFARLSDAMVLDAAAHVAANACERLARGFDPERERDRRDSDSRGDSTPVPSDVVGSIPERACAEIFARCPPPSSAPAVAAWIRRARAVDRSNVGFRSGFIGFDGESSTPRRRRIRRGLRLAASFSGRRFARRVDPRGVDEETRFSSDESSDEYESSTADVAAFAEATAIRIARAKERGDDTRRALRVDAVDDAPRNTNARENADEIGNEIANENADTDADADADVDEAARADGGSDGRPGERVSTETLARRG